MQQGAVEPCAACGIEDALGRHAPDCSHALHIGLPRLAEGEDPIPVHEDDDPLAESGYDGPVAAEGEVSPNHPAHPQWHDDQLHDRTGTIEREPPPGFPMEAYQRPDGLWETRPATPDAMPIRDLWISYYESEFDAVIFASELEALRYAVEHGWKVRELQLGLSLRQQIHEPPV